MGRNSLEEHIIRGTAELPVGIYEFKVSENGPIPLHYHSEFEFLVLTEGSASVRLEGEVIDLKPFEGVFINSRTLHSSADPAGEAQCSFTAVVFAPDFIAPEYDGLYKKYVAPVIQGSLAVPVRLPEEAVRLVLEANQLYSSGSGGHELAVKGNIIRAMAVCSANAERAEGIKSDASYDAIKKTIDYMHMSYDKGVTLTDLAAHAHMSREHLCRVFGRASGMSPIIYLNRYRIAQSAHMLLNTDKSISDIASSCGFNNSSYFNKLFMRFMSCTPTQYRNLILT